MLLQIIKAFNFNDHENQQSNQTIDYSLEAI